MFLIFLLVMILADLCNWQYQPKVFATLVKLRLAATSTVISHIYEKRTIAFWILPKFCCLVCLGSWHVQQMGLSAWCTNTFHMIRMCEGLRSSRLHLRQADGGHDQVALDQWHSPDRHWCTCHIFP